MTVIVFVHFVIDNGNRGGFVITFVDIDGGNSGSGGGIRFCIVDVGDDVSGGTGVGASCGFFTTMAFFLDLITPFSFNCVTVVVNCIPIFVFIGVLFNTKIFRTSVGPFLPCEVVFVLVDIVVVQYGVLVLIVVLVNP